MRLTVVPVQPAASATVTRARASIAVTIPLAAAGAEFLVVAAEHSTLSSSVTATLPVTSVDYILLSADSQLDTTGRYQYKSHSVVVTEHVAFEYAKTLDNAVFVPEVVILSPTLGKTDSVSLVEAFAKVLTFTRSFADNISMVDALLFATTKAIADTAVLSDAAQKTAAKPFYSDVGTTDSARPHALLGKNDTATTVDAASRQFSKFRTDTFSFVDYVGKGFVRPLFDSYAPVDRIVVSFSKALYDGFGLNDSAESTDNVFVLNAKGVSNVVFASEAAVFATAKVRSDSVPVLSSGSLRAQNYCDFSYFAEDYVGESRVF